MGFLQEKQNRMYMVFVGGGCGKTEKNPSEPEHLKTVRGLGYMWEE